MQTHRHCGLSWDARMSGWAAILGLGTFLVCCVSSKGAGAEPIVVLEEHHPCAEFDSGTPVPSGWTLADCSDVWKSWTSSLLPKDAPGYYQDLSKFYPIGAEQRLRGLPCQVQFMFVNDGAGSRAMRILAAWVMAAEMGCDLIRPDQIPDPSASAGGPPLYCHEMVRSEVENPRGTSPDDKSAHCVLVDWLSYFNLHESFAKTNVTNDARTKILRVGALRGIQSYTHCGFKPLFQVYALYSCHCPRRRPTDVPSLWWA